MKTALLLIDIQKDYFPKGKMPLKGSSVACDNARLLLESFRKRNFPIVHVQHISTRPETEFFLPNTMGAEIHDNLKPKEGEKVIVKHFPNSFKDTELLEHLKSLQVFRLVICGMMTHMCVDSTVRAAKDHGFQILLIGDACATKNLKINGENIPAQDVQNSFLAALSYFFSEVCGTHSFLEKIDERA